MWKVRGYHQAHDENLLEQVMSCGINIMQPLSYLYTRVTLLQLFSSFLAVALGPQEAVTNWEPQRSKHLIRILYLQLDNIGYWVPWFTPRLKEKETRTNFWEFRIKNRCLNTFDFRWFPRKARRFQTSVSEFEKCFVYNFNYRLGTHSCRAETRAWFSHSQQSAAAKWVTQKMCQMARRQNKIKTNLADFHSRSMKNRINVKMVSDLILLWFSFGRGQKSHLFQYFVV